MTFYEIIKAGKHIKIEETDKKRNYDPADFWEENGRLYVRNDELGTCNLHITAEQFNNHIANMIRDNFRIIIE